MIGDSTATYAYDDYDALRSSRARQPRPYRNDYQL
jgi:hypothetical protein